MSAAALPEYPAVFRIQLAGDPVYTAESLKKLIANYGENCVVLGRFPSGIQGAVTTMSVVKYGIMGRFMKVFPLADVRPYLDADELKELADPTTGEDRPAVVVCTPPADGVSAMMIAQLAVDEESFVRCVLQRYRALDATAGNSDEVVGRAVSELTRHFDANRCSHMAHSNAVQPPQGNWDIYVAGKEAPTPDRVASAIKGYANHSMRVYPELPRMFEAELDALIEFCRLLAKSETSTPVLVAPATIADTEDTPEAPERVISVGLNRAAMVMATALSSPEFARACHSRLFRDAALADVARLAPWKSFGPDMLGFLLSEELTYASRRLARPKTEIGANASADDDNDETVDSPRAGNIAPVLEDDPVRFPRKATPALPFIFRLSEVIAMGVPNSPGSVEAATWRLDQYVGGYLSELDLSRTLITGGAMAASLIVTDVERAYWRGSSEWRDAYDQFLRDRRAHTEAVFEDSSIPFNDESIEAERGGDNEVDDEAGDDDNGDDEEDEADNDAAHATDKRASKPTTAAEADKAAYLRYIACHYAPVVTTVPGDRKRYLRCVYRAMTSKTTPRFDMIDGSPPQVILSVGGPAVTLDIESGADVDMAVDVETAEEFDAVARAHYEVIRRRHPHAKLDRVVRPDPGDTRYTWKIYTEELNRLPHFRSVEIYRANFNHVITHHVGMVSGAYTAMFSKDPEFVMSARLVCAMNDLATPNYYYFASRKTLAQNVVAKYYHRGFGLEAFPRGIITAMGVAFRAHAPGMMCHRRTCFPAARGVSTFSVFSLPIEQSLRPKV